MKCSNVAWPLSFFCVTKTFYVLITRKIFRLTRCWMHLWWCIWGLFICETDCLLACLSQKWIMIRKANLNFMQPAKKECLFSLERWSTNYICCILKPEVLHFLNTTAMVTWHLSVNVQWKCINYISSKKCHHLSDILKSLRLHIFDIFLNWFLKWYIVASERHCQSKATCVLTLYLVYILTWLIMSVYMRWAPNRLKKNKTFGS